MEKENTQNENKDLPQLTEYEKNKSLFGKEAADTVEKL